jgi:hypothetical protein
VWYAGRAAWLAVFARREVKRIDRIVSVASGSEVKVESEAKEAT